MGYRSATLNTRLRRTRAGAFYATLRACFFAGDTPVAQHAVYFPDAFLTQMREAMPSTLSFDEFISAANARCAAVYASIRLKSPWLISLP